MGAVPVRPWAIFVQVPVMLGDADALEVLVPFMPQRGKTVMT